MYVLKYREAFHPWNYHCGGHNLNVDNDEDGGGGGGGGVKGTVKFIRWLRTWYGIGCVWDCAPPPTISNNKDCAHFGESVSGNQK